MDPAQGGPACYRRPAQPIPPSIPLVGFLEIRGGVFVVSAAAGQGGSLLRRVEDVDLLLN